MRTLQQVANETGIAYQVLKKHAQRGKLRVHNEDGRVLVDETDLDAYLSAELLSVTAENVKGMPADGVAREIGNAIARMPNKVVDAILAGLPTSKHAGSPEPWRQVVGDLPPPVDLKEDDPHYGFPIGHKHRDRPRWGRTSTSTWSLDGATFSWNGMFWEGGGLREGAQLAEGIAPSHPHSSMRPLSIPQPVKR